MTDLFDGLAALGNRPLLARSLFMHHQILGPEAGAARRLESMAGRILQLPVGADIARQNVSIEPAPHGFDIHEGAVGQADALFAFVSTPGLTLSMSSETRADGRVLRRLQVLDRQGQPFRRTGPERFMLRTSLSPQVLRAREAIVLSLVREEGTMHSRLPPLQPWIEVRRGADRRYVDTVECAAGWLGEGQVVRLQAFAPGALAEAGADPGITTVQLYLELTGDVVDLTLIGEALLV